MKPVAPVVLFALTLATPCWLSAHEAAADPALDVVPPAHFARPQGRRPFPGTGKVIDSYIQEQTQAGLLDSTAFDKLKAQQKTLRDEIKTLRDAGDEQAVRAKMDEARTLRQTRQRLVRDLVQNDADLRARLQEHRAQIRDRRRDHGDQRRELQRERLRQRDQARQQNRA